MGRRIERISEDWLAVAIGLAVFALSLGPVVGLDLLGWATAPKTWIDMGEAVQPAGASPLGGAVQPSCVQKRFGGAAIGGSLPIISFAPERVSSTFSAIALIGRC